MTYSAAPAPANPADNPNPAAPGAPAAAPAAAPPRDPRQDFLAAQTLFFDWTSVICELIQERLAEIQPQLAEKRVAYDPADPTHIAVYAKGVDFAEWRMDLHFSPRRDAPRPPDDAWRQEVETLILTALAPLRALLPALGVNEYLFEGLNSELDGVSLPIEPYEDSDLLEQLRYLCPAAARAYLADKGE